MPDIQTEMQKILQAWEQPYPLTETAKPTEPTKETIVFTPTTNTSRATFEVVRDNPYKTKAEYIKLLDRKGYKSGSTSSLLAQMVKQGHLSVDDMGLMHANQNEYRPLKSAKTFAKKTSKVITSKKYKTKEVPVPEGIAALVTEHKDKIKIKDIDQVQHIMDTISLPDAKRLYRALAEYFGSV